MGNRYRSKGWRRRDDEADMRKIFRSPTTSKAGQEFAHSAMRTSANGSYLYPSTVVDVVASHRRKTHSRSYAEKKSRVSHHRAKTRLEKQSRSLNYARAAGRSV